MKTLELSQAIGTLADYVRDLGDEPVILTAETRPVAALVNLKRVDPESLALSTHPDFLDIIAAARKEVEEGATFSLAEVKADLL
jgi:antitoxin (DNA-binding transcriptional repressor) of toxin-antitoxin stability system